MIAGQILHPPPGPQVSGHRKRAGRGYHILGILPLISIISINNSVSYCPFLNWVLGFHPESGQFFRQAVLLQTIAYLIRLFRSFWAISSKTPLFFFYLLYPIGEKAPENNPPDYIFPDRRHRNHYDLGRGFAAGFTGIYDGVLAFLTTYRPDRDSRNCGQAGASP